MDRCATVPRVAPDALGEARDAEVRRTRLDAAIDALVEDRP